MKPRVVASEAPASCMWDCQAHGSSCSSGGSFEEDNLVVPFVLDIGRRTMHRHMGLYVAAVAFPDQLSGLG